MPLGIRDLKASRKGLICRMTRLRLDHNNSIDHTAGDNGITGTGRCADYPVNLNYDLAMVCFYRLADGQRIARHIHIIE